MRIKYATAIKESEEELTQNEHISIHFLREVSLILYRREHYISTRGWYFSH